MPDATTTSYLTISDFSPGIQTIDDLGSEATNPAPTGAASAFDISGSIGTYDCYSLPEGGLGPLPFRFTPLTNGPGVQPDLANNLAPGKLYTVGGLHVAKFYIGETAAATVNSTDYSSVFVTLTYPFDAGAGNVTRRVRPYRYDTSISTLTELLNPAGATPALESPNWTAPTLTFLEAFTPMTDYRTNGNTNPTIPGPPYVYIGVCDPSVSWGANGISRFPNSAFAATDRIESMFARKQTLFLVSHQGRLFINCQETPFTFGPREVLHNDDSYWTVPNQNGLDNGGATSALSQAVVGSYGSIDSSNANELVIIRSTSEGGMIITSDLNSPIVADYKTMQGTSGCIVEGVWTPMGYVYGAREGGVYLYSGGGRTQLLSPNLENGFWHPKDNVAFAQGATGQGFLAPGAGSGYNPIPLPHLGKFGYHGGFVFCPNNWAYDITQNNWWRFSGQHLGSDLDYRYYDTSPFGTIFAAKANWSAGRELVGHARIIQDFGNQLGCNIPDTYKWTSTFIPIAQESEVNEVREIVCNYTATPGDQITIRLWADRMVGSNWNEDFTTTAAGSFRCMVSPGIRGQKLVLQILCIVANPQANECPIINRVDIGLGKVSMIANTLQ